MARLVFNSATISGTEIAPEDFVWGSGVINSASIDKDFTTLDHRIRRVRTAEAYSASCELYGDKSLLTTSSTDTDNDNLGGTQVFAFDGTSILSFDGVVTALYNPEERTTTVRIKGEADNGREL